jgi:hypothetical protein
VILNRIRQYFCSQSFGRPLVRCHWLVRRYRRFPFSTRRLVVFLALRAIVPVRRGCHGRGNSLSLSRFPWTSRGSIELRYGIVSGRRLARDHRVVQVILLIGVTEKRHLGQSGISFLQSAWLPRRRRFSRLWLVFEEMQVRIIVARWTWRHPLGLCKSLLIFLGGGIDGAVSVGLSSFSSRCRRGNPRSGFAFGAGEGRR